MKLERPLKLVAPWYRWERQALEHGRAPRETRPVLQKYETAAMTNDFIVDPQRCLKFVDDDCVALVEGSPYRGTVRKFADRRLLRVDSPLPGTAVRRCDLRKVFLNTHKRFYLVVCALHCDTVGFPDADREHICESGFVVRRRHLPDSATTSRLAAEIGSTRRRLLQLTQEFVKDGASGHPVPPIPIGRTVQQEIALTTRQLASLREELKDLWRVDGHADAWERWEPDRRASDVGEWKHADEMGNGELVYPLFPLIPDPTLPYHSAEGATLVYGLVPTGSLLTTASGEAQLDDKHVYSIHCFVRRHREGCPKKRTRADCPGPLIWSEPTEAYSLAAHFDLAGTRNTVVTIHMPDLPLLAAQAAATRVGQGGSVRMVTPPDSGLPVKVDDMVPQEGEVGGGGTCTDSIPLITIVAKFVYELFKPIVIYLYQLYYLLPLKFCMPPSLDLGGIGGSLATLESPTAGDAAKESAKSTVLSAIFGAYGVSGISGQVSGHITQLKQEFSAADIAALARNLGTDTSSGGAPPSLTEGLEFEERVSPRPRVDAPVFVEMAGV